MSRYSFLLEAEAEYLEAIRFYEEQRLDSETHLSVNLNALLSWLLGNQKLGA